MKYLIGFTLMMFIGPLIFAVNLHHKNSIKTKVELVKADWECVKTTSVIILVGKVPAIHKQCNEYKRIRE